MSRKVSWLLSLLLFGGFAGLVGYVLWQRAQAGKGLPDYSVYSEEANGLADAARFLRRLGWEPIALTRPIQQGRVRGLLILTEPKSASPLPGAGPLSENDVKGLLRWVESGNTLLYCARHPSGLHEALDVALLTEDAPTLDDVRRVAVASAGGYTEEVRHMAAEGTDILTSPEGLPLWWHDKGMGAVVRKYGEGRIILVTDPSLLTFRGLRREDNAVFVYNLARLHARDGKVYFDEYHHGLQSGGGVWGYLAYHGAHGVLVALLLVVAVAVWAVAIRLGPAVPRPREIHADAVDYASAVARIYERAGVRRLLARALTRGFLNPLTRHLHLRRNALPAEILAAWRQQHPGDSGERLQALLRGLAELRKGNITERQLLAWAQAFDRFQAEVLRAR